MQLKTYTHHLAAQLLCPLQVRWYELTSTILLGVAFGVDDGIQSTALVIGAASSFWIAGELRDAKRRASTGKTDVDRSVTWWYQFLYEKHDVLHMHLLVLFIAFICALARVFV